MYSVWFLILSIYSHADSLILSLLRQCGCQRAHCVLLLAGVAAFVGTFGEPSCERVIVSEAGSVLRLTAPMMHPHNAGEAVVAVAFMGFPVCGFALRSDVRPRCAVMYGRFLGTLPQNPSNEK